jgi:hypothetical protein
MTYHGRGYFWQTGDKVGILRYDRDRPSLIKYWFVDILVYVGTLHDHQCRHRGSHMNI